MNFYKFVLLSKVLLLFFLAALLSTPAWGVRVKDVAALRGARDNELIGFGIVVGLDGTGDTYLKISVILFKKFHTIF